jgi:hypothetical protein
MATLGSFSIRRIPMRLCVSTLRTQRTFKSRSTSQKSTPILKATEQSLLVRPVNPLFSNRLEIRRYASKTTADEILEEIQDQYATAKDEFEIAHEETELKTVYAADDRAAAREELNTLKDMYNEALEGPEGEEVKRRVGQRIRE